MTFLCVVTWLVGFLLLPERDEPNRTKTLMGTVLILGSMALAARNAGLL